jgi:capsular exopolysaccharide synthesis family protein
MSHIFDALQRSEAERSGVARPSSVTAAELLECAEHQALLQWEGESISARSSRRECTNAGLEFVTPAIQPEDLAQETSGIRISEAGGSTEYAKAFESFQAVEASLFADNRLVCLTDKGSPAAEAFRLLKVRLRHLRKDRPLKRLLITSTAPQEGKSFVAGNIACALASGSGEKILLVGGDLRRPSLSQLFGVGGKPGICEHLRGKRALAPSIYFLKEAGIWFLPAGSAEGDPLEIVQSAQLPVLMERLAGWFDWIIIDSPPVLPLADTTSLARLADGILIVARRGITEKRQLRKGLEAFDSGKLIGALVNSSNGATDKDYYYYRHEAAVPGKSKDHSRLIPPLSSLSLLPLLSFQWISRLTRPGDWKRD